MNKAHLRSAIATALLLLAASSATGQELDPNNKRGFEAGKLYNFFGLDSVSTFSGNLNLAIPIGQSYSVRPGFSYQFYLSYNSKIWDYRYEESLSARVGYPEEFSNSGLGWLLTLGQVIPGPYNNQWVYVSPDGAHHDFHSATTLGVYYTRDGSYLRMKRTPASGVPVTRVDIETPDGLTHSFNGDGALTEISDRYGNWVQVVRDGNVWKFEEGHGTGATRQVARWHKVTFENAPSGHYNNTNFLTRVKTIELAAFPTGTQTTDQARAVYTFDYYDDPVVIEASSCEGVTEGQQPPDTHNVPLLESITLPDGSSYGMTYDVTNVATCSSGALNKLALPTKGAIKWTYGGYEMAREECTDITPEPHRWADEYAGVVVRQLIAHDGAEVQTTRYEPKLGSSPGNGMFTCEDQWILVERPPKTFTNEVKTTTGTANPLEVHNRTLHYFSALRNLSAGYTDAKPEHYGLPFTATQKLAEIPLSTKTYGPSDPNDPDAPLVLLRTTYADYETDGPGGQQYNQRLRVSRTVFHGDTGDPLLDSFGTDTTVKRCEDSEGVSDCWVQQTNDNFDGFGHYRWQSTASNIPDSRTRSAFKNYNPGYSSGSTWPVNAPWLLNTYTTSTVSEGGTGRDSTATFDSDTGDLISMQTGEYYWPLLSATCRDQRGFITSQRWLGGDARALPADPCTATRRDGEAFLDHSYTFSGVALVEHSATWQGTSHTVIDEELDSNTGLPSSTSDSAGLVTTYTFDKSSRLTSIAPPATATTSYSYTNATLANNVWTPPKVDAETTSATAGKIHTQYQYDSLGRLWREKTLMPDNSWSVRETLYDQRGNKASASEMVKLQPAAGQTEYAFVPAHKTIFSGYDGFGRPGTITSPDGKTTTLAYIGDRVTTRTVGMGTSRSGEEPVVTTERFDAHGRLLSVTEADTTPGAMMTSYTYDVSGAVASVSMPSGDTTQTRTFSYDSRNLLASEKHPELGQDGNGTITYSKFDAQGRPGQKVTAGIDLRTTYDAAGRLTAVKQTIDSQDLLLKQLTYDTANGRLTEAKRFNHLPGNLGTVTVTETLSYDNTSGRPVSRQVGVSNSAPFPERQFAHTQTFNDLGLVTQIGYPVRVGSGEVQRTISYTYANGSLSSVPGWATAVTYQPNGMMARVDHAGGVAETWTADPNGMARPRAITVAKGTSPAYWSSGEYSFDGAGNITAIGITSYIYDRFARLISWGTSTGSSYTFHGYEYDAFGNRIGVSTSGCSSMFRCYTTAVLSRSVTGVTNRYKDAAHDASGNVLTDGGRTFTYDAVNMPTSVSVGGRTFTYLYTADDERIAAAETLSPTTYKTTWTLRGFRNELLTVRDGDTWKDDEIWRGTSLVGRNTPLGKRHYSLDHLGTPRLITDDNGNAVGTLLNFDPFGVGGASDAGALQYTGHERDAANLGGGTADLPDYAHARLLDTRAGRFLSVDPVLDLKQAMTNPQGWNRYAYVFNNPLRFTDPTGKYVCRGDEVACKTIEGGLNKMRESAAAMKKNDPKRAELQQVINAYGKPGDPSTKIKTVWVNPTNANGTPLLPRNVMGQVGRDGLVAVSLMNIAAKAGGDGQKAFTMLGGTLTHEGKHQLQPAVVGLQGRPSLLSLLHYELQAYTLEKSYYQGLGQGAMAPDPTKGAWGSANTACQQVGCDP